MSFSFRNTRLLGKVYYQLFADDYEIQSKVAFDHEEPSIGRIRADSIAPPHSPTSIKRCISRVEGRPTLLHADLFADTSCDTPLTEGHISILRTDGPGQSPDQPMAIVQADVQVEIPLPVEVPVSSIPDGRYIIKNRASDFYWGVGVNDEVYFCKVTLEYAKQYTDFQVEFSNYSSVQRIILFQSMTSQTTLMVTSI